MTGSETEDIPGAAEIQGRLRGGGAICEGSCMTALGENRHSATASMGVRGQRRQFAVIWGWGAQHGGSQT